MAHGSVRSDPKNGKSIHKIYYWSFNQKFILDKKEIERLTGEIESSENLFILLQIALESECLQLQKEIKDLNYLCVNLSKEKACLNLD